MREHSDQQQDRQEHNAAAALGEVATRDSAPTRRALLTGGAVVAGAAAVTLATTQEAAAANVILGTVNDEKNTTTFRSSGERAVTGICSAENAIALSGSSLGAHGSGVLGMASASADSFGVWGIGNAGIGVRGESSNGTGVSGVGGYVGVLGSGDTYGAIFHGNGSRGGGVYATGPIAVYGSGSTYGVQGRGPTGIYGVGDTIGVRGYTVASGGRDVGVLGEAAYRGVTGLGGTSGVYGSSSYVGVWADGERYGVYGRATGTSGPIFGVFGITNSPAGFAGYFQGNARVTGTLSKAAGSFQIDHPLDPDHKWLRHSFVESPDMMNVYNGNVTTDSAGLATVKLPAYFTALNRDFRYQLTVIGKMAHAIVDREIASNQFRIRPTRAT